MISIGSIIGSIYNNIMSNGGITGLLPAIKRACKINFPITKQFQ